MLFAASQHFKMPLHTLTRSLLGEWVLSGVELRPQTSLIDRISTVAKIAFSSLGVLFTLPLWVIGEIGELCTLQGRALFYDEAEFEEKATDEIVLDPDKTCYMGTAVSTFQATSNRRFCQGSAIHTALATEELGFAQGVDILTEPGRKQIADRLKEMNANAFRFSVEWADVKQNGLDRYIEAARYFHSRDFHLMVTLDHWIGDGTVDAFEKAGDQEAFVDHAEKVFKALRPYCCFFLTFNEPNVDAAQKYVMGDLPPHKTANFAQATRLVALKLKAHRAVFERYQILERAYRAAHPADQGILKVGLSHQAICMRSDSRWNLIARITAFVISHIFHELFMRLAVQQEMKDTLDFIGLQYYARPLAGRRGWQIVDSIATPNHLCPEGWMVEGMKYRFDPQGILPVLKSVYARLAKPIVVTETGSAGAINPHAPSPHIIEQYYDAASQRCSSAAVAISVQERAYSQEMEKRKARYYKLSLQAIREAQDQGVDVKGVFLWTLFDNLEWQHGYKSACMFGILARDLKTGLFRITEGFQVIRQIFAQTMQEGVRVAG